MSLKSFSCIYSIVCSIFVLDHSFWDYFYLPVFPIYRDKKAFKGSKNSQFWLKRQKFKSLQKIYFSADKTANFTIKWLIFKNMEN